VDGKEYIDFSSQWAVVNLGHNHPEVIEAVRSQLERLVFSSHTTFPNTVAIELAERLVELTPGSFEKKVWFGLTGSDANELIYKIMPVYSRRRRMLGFQGSYHGQTMGALSLSGHKALTRFIGFPNVVKAPTHIVISGHPPSHPRSPHQPYPSPPHNHPNMGLPLFLGEVSENGKNIERCDVYGVLASATFSLNSVASHISSQTSPRYSIS